MNTWVGIGRLVRDPEVRYTQSGKACVKFTLAIDRRKSADGKQQADFVPCVAWEKTAEITLVSMSQRDRRLPWRDASRRAAMTRMMEASAM